MPDPQLFMARYTTQLLTITPSAKGHLKLVVNTFSDYFTLHKLRNDQLEMLYTICSNCQKREQRWRHCSNVVIFDQDRHTSLDPLLHFNCLLKRLNIF